MGNATINLPGGKTVEIVREMVTVESWMPETDPDWTYVDNDGHRHSTTSVRREMSAKWIETSPAYTDSDGEEYNADGEYRCVDCQEVLHIGTRTPGPQHIITGESYYIDGERVTKEAAEALVDAYLDKVKEKA